MALSPLKIKLIEAQKRIAQTAIQEHTKRSDPILGCERPIIIGDTLIADPTDFVFLMAVAPHRPETELETFRLRTLGVAEMESRLGRCKHDSTKMAYRQLIGHARDAFPIGSALGSNLQPARRPFRMRSRGAVALVPALPPR